MAKYMKLVETAMRRTGRTLDGCPLSIDVLAECVGLNMFTGRARHGVNWTPEYNNRCDVNYKLDLRHPITEEPLPDSEHLRPFVAEQIAPCLQVASLARKTWVSFCANANSWVTPGAPSGCHIRYDDPDANPIRGDVTKRILFEYLDSANLIPFLDSEPYVLGSALKYENEKARTIYSTGIIDYTIMTYVLGPLDANWTLMPHTECALSSLEEIHAAQRRVRLADTHHTYTSMGDYADFNRQHTLAAQALVFDVIAQLMSEGSAGDSDYARAARWCRDALLNQYVYFPHPVSPRRSEETIARGPGWRVTRHTRHHAFRVVQGLFLGVRGTSYINTVLNAA